MTPPGSGTAHVGIYYGWWIVLAAFLNLFFLVGILFYGFPVFYPYFVESLDFTRAQVTQGFFLGFLFAGLPFGVLAGSLIDKFGAQRVILGGVALAGSSLLLMSFMKHFWQFEILCIAEVIGFVFAGPIANQVLIARWFDRRRGQAMVFAYLGLGLGGVTASVLANHLALQLGWRHALELIGAVIPGVLLPVGVFVTRSSPQSCGLRPEAFGETHALQGQTPALVPSSITVRQAAGSAPFWLILLGSTLAIAAIGAVIQHYILFLKDSGYSATAAARYSTLLLTASLCGHVIVGYFADRLSKSYVMGSRWALTIC
jgi:MFS family permease